jgi:hypothetical protein
MNAVIIETKNNLEKRGYSVYVCDNKRSILELINTNILPTDISNMVIGLGHSETLEDINVLEELRGRNAKVYFHKPPLTSAEDDRKTFLSEFYFLSANAISKDGYIVNIDGTGNRTAASCFGPKNVVFVIGKNKIVETLDEAMDRALNYASIELTRKYDREKLPCMSKGKCIECFTPGCICGVITIHRKQLFGNKTIVILVDENMGI